MNEHPFDLELAVELMVPLTGICKITRCRRRATLLADLRYCECCEHTERMCFQVHPKSMGHTETTEICDEHGTQVRLWYCLVRIYSRENSERGAT